MCTHLPESVVCSSHHVIKYIISGLSLRSLDHPQFLQQHRLHSHAKIFFFLIIIFKHTSTTEIQNRCLYISHFIYLKVKRYLDGSRSHLASLIEVQRDNLGEAARV